MWQSLPVIQPQPNQQFYPLSALELFQRTTREAFEAAGGPLLPFDTSRGEQTFYDSSATGPQSYLVRNAAGDGLETVTMDISKPNFKGLPSYGKWNPAPTPAAMPHAAPAQPTPVDPKELSTEDQAKALMAELGGSSYVDTGLESLSLPFFGQIEFPINYGAETRRSWAVVLSNGKRFNVGEALAMKYENGIGSSGKWAPDSFEVSGLTWQATRVADGSQSTLPAVPMPLRALLPNEKAVMVGVGGLGFQQLQIERMDLAPAPAGTPVADPTAADTHAIAMDVQAKVNRIYAAVFPNG